MAKRLALDPKLTKLARDLGISTRGPVLDALRAYGIDTVRRWVEQLPINDMEGLRRLVSSRVSAKAVLIRHDSDVQQIAEDFRDFHPSLRSRLEMEFIEGETEGITLERDGLAPGLHRYLAVIDARGARAARAYFTLWHELSHLILHPPQLAFPGFRRAPTPEVIARDPLEFAVDQLAGLLAFYEPLYRPALEQEIAKDGCLTFRAISSARDVVAPDASFFAGAVGALRLIETPAAFVSVRLELKKGEQRAIASGQSAFDFAVDRPQPKLRVTNLIATGSAQPSLEIRTQMRVPAQSVLTTVFDSNSDVVISADEDQGWWETSGKGHLTPTPLRVEAMRRGRYVYGLIRVLHAHAVNRPATRDRSVFSF